MQNLWIDDIRTPPKGYLWAKNSHEALAIIGSSAEPFNHISFDHDLGGEDTSRRIVLWLCENEGFWPKYASVHSMNPIGKEWLTKMIQRYGTSCTLV